ENIWPGMSIAGDKSTPFTITLEPRNQFLSVWGYKALFTAPNASLYNGVEYVFFRWRVEQGVQVFYVYNSTLNLTEVDLDSSRYWKLVAEYYPQVTPPPSGGQQTTIHLNGSVYYLPYQWIVPFANFSAGLYRIDVEPLFGAPRDLLVAVLVRNGSGSHRYVCADGLVFNMTESKCCLQCMRGVRGEYGVPEYTAPTANYSGYYFIGLAVMNWLDSSQEALLEPWLLDNGTTLAVYNLTITYINGSQRIVYWQIVAVTSVNLEVNAVYDNSGVYVVWNVSYSHLIPRWLAARLNLTEEKPYQYLRLSAFYRKKELWRVRLSEVPDTLDLPESPFYSYGAVYVNHSTLQKIFGFENATVRFIILWTAINIPFAKSINVKFAPIAVEWVRFRNMSDHYYWQFKVRVITGNKAGPVLRAGSGVLNYIDISCMHCPRNATRISSEIEFFEVRTPKFKIGGPNVVFKIWYVPRPTRNLVFYEYWGEFYGPGG
ncbi:MAG: hypothetical protein DRJ52_09275, partial [Thermoprotei archaeon]